MSRNHCRLGSTQKRALQRAKIFARDFWRCRKCGAASRLELDHKVPLSKGGTDESENLQALCTGCHIAKTKRENSKRPPNPAMDAAKAEWQTLLSKRLRETA